LGFNSGLGRSMVWIEAINFASRPCTWGFRV